MEKITCCICGKSVNLVDSHDAHPLSENGRCCSECNYSKVLVQRSRLSRSQELRDLYQRLLEIREEVKNNPKPKLNSSSLEDWDDLAQAKLEWNWWKEEILEEYNKIKLEFGLVDDLKFN